MNIQRTCRNFDSVFSKFSRVLASTRASHKFSYPQPHLHINDRICSVVLLLLLFVTLTHRPPPGGTKISLTLFRVSYYSRLYLFIPHYLHDNLTFPDKEPRRNVGMHQIPLTTLEQHREKKSRRTIVKGIPNNLIANPWTKQ